MNLINLRLNLITIEREKMAMINKICKTCANFFLHPDIMSRKGNVLSFVLDKSSYGECKYGNDQSLSDNKACCVYEKNQGMFNYKIVNIQR